MCKVNSSLYTGGKAFVAKTSVARGESHWIPNTDVYVTEDSLVVKVELAGMHREDLELTIDGNQLKIAGQRHDGCRAPKCTFIVMEIPYGAFECVVEVPSGYDLSRAKAAYQNGFLRVDVPQNVHSGKKSFVAVSGGK